MAKFQRKYSQAQLDAIVHAAVDLGWIAQRVSNAARAGKLGVPAFTVPKSTVQAYARDERSRRADMLGTGSGSLSKVPMERAAEVVRRATLTLVEETLVAAQRLAATDLRRMQLARDATRTLAELRKLEAAPSVSPKAEAKERPSGDTQRIARKARRRAEHQDPPTNGHAEGPDAASMTRNARTSVSDGGPNLLDRDESAETLAHASIEPNSPSEQKPHT